MESKWIYLEDFSLFFFPDYSLYPFPMHELKKQVEDGKRSYLKLKYILCFSHGLQLFMPMPLSHDLYIQICQIGAL